MELVLLPLLLCFKPSFPPLNRSVNMKHDRHFFFLFLFVTKETLCYRFFFNLHFKDMEDGRVTLREIGLSLNP